MLAYIIVDDRPPTQKLLDAALELFAENGYGSTSIKRIAQRAGVSQGLMYTYFPSKAALLQEIFLTGLRDIEASWRELPGEDPHEDLRSLLTESFRLVSEHANFWRLFYAIRSQKAVATELAEELSAWSGLIHERLTRYCQALGTAHPELEASVLLAFIDGVSQQLVINEDYPLEEVVTTFVARYEKEKL